MMKKKKKCLLIDLPEDLLINNILLSSNPKVLLPIKSLLSLRCVCKYLRKLITSPDFINMHLHHSTTTTSPSPPPQNHHQLNNLLVLIHPNAPAFCSLKFNDGVTGDPCHPEVVKFASPMKNPLLWGSCNGLLCLSTKGVDDRVCLWNPVTKEYKLIPPPLPFTQIIPIGITEVTDYASITYGFGYDRFIDDYKIIRCQHSVRQRNGTNDYDYYSIIEFQVYTLGTNTWRKISSDKNPYKSYCMIPPFLINKSIVFVNGALHWFMSKSFKWRKKIVSFDIEKEVFREIQKPLMISKQDYNFSSKIQVLGGCLCLFDFNKSGNMDCFNVWMMMDYGVKESWTKLFTVVQKEVPQFCYNEVPSSYKLLRFCENGEILIGIYDILFTYDPLNDKARRVEFGETDRNVFQFETYMESLVSLNTTDRNVFQFETYMESLVSLNTGVYKGEEVFED